MAYVDLDTIQIPTAGSNYPTAAWGAQVNANFDYLKAELDARSAVTNTSIVATGDISTTGDVSADSYVRLGDAANGHPMVRIKRFGGTLDASGNGFVALAVPANGGTRFIAHGAYWQGAGDEEKSFVRVAIDGSNFYVYMDGTDAAAAGKKWIGSLIYTEDAPTWASL